MPCIHWLIEDQVIRRFVDDRLNRQPPYAAVAKVEIERTRNEVKVVLHTARPGLVIGPKGAQVDKLKEKGTISCIMRQYSLSFCSISF